MVYGVLWLTISENSWAGFCGFGILLKNPSQTRPIPIEVNQLAPVQSTRHSCWVPEGSGQAVPTTQPAPIYYRGMLSYCGAFLSSFVLILSSPIQKIFLTLNLKQMLRLML